MFFKCCKLIGFARKKDIEIGFINNESIKKLNEHNDIKVNFEIIANVPLYKSSDQKEYNIIKLKTN